MQSLGGWLVESGKGGGWKGEGEEGVEWKGGGEEGRKSGRITPDVWRRGTIC